MIEEHVAAGVASEPQADARATSTSGATPPSTIVALVEGALLVDIVVVLCVIRTFIPIPGFQGIIRLVCPAPIVLLGMRRGVRSTIIATIGGYVVLSALVGPLFGTQILVYGLLGTVYSAAARFRLPYIVALLGGTVLYGGYIAFISVGVPLILGIINLHISATALIGKIRDQLRSVGHTIGSLHFGSLRVKSLPLMGDARSLFHWTLDHWAAALVAIVIIYGLINSWAFLFVSREVLAHVDRGVRVDEQGKPVDFYPPTQF